MMKMRYTIEIEYQTGDTFQTYETSDDVGITWENLEVAKAALERIKVHHEAYEKADGWGSTSEHREAFTKVPGYVEGYSISLPLDDGSEHKTFTFWHGYFEHMQSAEIVPAKDWKEMGGMKYVP
jgi:hypothetical protein